MNTQTVAVVTLPRSGSSLLAGMIHHLGVPMGAEEDLEKGRHLNRFGCYEDQEFQRISLNILFEADILLDLTRRLNLDEAAIAAAVKRHEPSIRRFCKREHGCTWGFKDPGLIYSLPHLHQHFRSPRYVKLTRGVDDTAQSLQKTTRPSYWIPEMRAKFPLFEPVNRLRLIGRAARLLVTRPGRFMDDEFFREVVRRGHQRIDEFFEGRPHLALELSEVSNGPRQTVDRIIDFLKINPSPDRIRRAVEFVHPELLHRR